MAGTDYIVRANITGRVQGVGFRVFVEREASRRSLHGWVRNRRDGSVEALFPGSRDVVEDMLAACRRGPMYSTVDSVSVEPATADLLIGPSFHVRGTV